MESDNSQQSFCGHQSMINPATHSHQDVDHATPQNGTSAEGRERDSARTKASGHLGAGEAGAVGAPSGSGRGEQQRERVSSPEKVGQGQKDATLVDASPMFKPLPDSVLHTAVQSPPKKLIKEPLFRPSPSSDEDETSPANDDVISLHSTDSEPASDTEDAIVVEDMISTYESLFTPPPVTDDDDTPLAYIKPLPSQSKKPTRYVMTHVEVPPLRRPKSDYKDARDMFPSKPRRKKPEQGQAHSSLLAALQAQMAHNSEIHDDEDMIVEKPPPKKKRKSVQRNAVAGPSRLPPTSDSARTKPKPKRRLIESSSSSSDEVAVPSSSRVGLISKDKGVKVARKRQKVTIDLTMDEDNEDDEGTPAVRATPRSPPCAASTPPQRVCQTSPTLSARLNPAIQNANHSSPLSSPTTSVSFRRLSFNLSPVPPQDHEAYQRLNLRIYPHPPPSILDVNTRFHRQQLQNTIHADNPISPSLSTQQNPERNFISDVSTPRRFPWGGGLMGGHSPGNNLAHDDRIDFISLGYTPLGPYDSAVDFESDDSDADVPTLKLERQPSMSPFVDDQRPRVRIDLAAELKKRKPAKKKQKQTQPNQAVFQPRSKKDEEGPGGGDVLVTSGSSLPLNIFSQHSDHLQTYLISPLPTSSTALGIGFQGLPTSTAAPPYAIRRPTGNLGVFMHDYTARPPSPDFHSQIASDSPSNTVNASSLASFSTAVGVGALYPSSDSLTLQRGPLGPHTNDTTTPAFFQPDTIFLAATEAGASQRLEADAMFPSGTVFDGGFAALNESWMTTGQQHAVDYGYDTVDPTLICGGFSNYDDRAMLPASTGELEFTKKGTAGDISGATGEECASSDDDREEAGIASMLSNVSKAGSLFSGHSGPPSVRSQSASAKSTSSSSSPTSSVAPLPTSLTSLDGSPSSQSAGSPPSKPSRLATSASFNPSGGLSSVKETLSAFSEERSRIFGTRCESSPLSDLTSISDASSVVTPAASQPNAIAAAKYVEGDVIIASKPRTPARGWEENIPDDEVYCHQCRSKNSHTKTRCACKAKYCSRCINARVKYIQVLNPGDRVYSCPRCEQWCVCTSCCKKRGEIYIPASAESTAPPPSVFATPALSPRLPPTPLPQSPRPYQLGHISRSSSHPRAALHTFKGVPPVPVTSRLSLSTNPGPSSQSTSGSLVPTSKKKSRIFIGKVHPSWGLGKKPRTRELNPAPRAVWPENPTGPCTVRYYIGSTNFLQHKQMRLETTDDLLAGLTSVASLEDSDPENLDDAASSTCHDEDPPVNVDESKVSSPALCQQDVARALSATYESLGHTVILSDEFRQ